MCEISVYVYKEFLKI